MWTLKTPSCVATETHLKCVDDTAIRNIASANDCCLETEIPAFRLAVALHFCLHETLLHQPKHINVWMTTRIRG